MMFRHKLKICAAILLLATSSSYAEDVRFKLLQGAGSNPYLELCRKLKAAVETRPPQPRFVCAQEFQLPNDQDFRRPQWESLDPLSNAALAQELFWRYYDQKGDLIEAQREAIWNGPTIGRYGVDGKIERFSPRELITRGDIALARARFDINFDGKIDNVYRLGIAGCQSSNQASAGDALAYSLHVVGSSDPELVKGTRAQLRLGIGDAFWFKGRIYLITSGAPIIYETIAVKESYGSLAIAPVCTFEATSVR